MRRAPLPKRPKGRWFVGLLLVGSLAAAGRHVWSSFFQYRAYGTVTCKTVEVAPPWDGVVAFVHHRQGDRVRQGDLLMTVRSLDLAQRGAQIADELGIEQAKLEAEAARIKWEAAYSLDQNRGAMASYYELQVNLLQEEAKLEETDASLARLEKPQVQGVVPKETLERLRISKRGQEARIAVLQESLSELRQRAAEADRLLRNGADLGAALLAHSRDQLKPSLARIAALKSERGRVAERLDQGEIRAPVGGIVLKQHRQVGESCKAGGAVMSLLDEASLQVVLYLDQQDSTRFEPGCTVELELEPYDHPLRCTLTRLGDTFEPAPDAIKRHYGDGEPLLPAFFEPAGDDQRWTALRTNGVVKLARTTARRQELAKR